MSTHLDSSTTTQMALVMVQHRRPRCSSWAKSVWSSFGRTLMGKAFWENPFDVRLGNGFQLGMLIRTPWKRVILICSCGWHQIGWKETEQRPNVESTHERLGCGLANIVLWPCLFGCIQRESETSKHLVNNEKNLYESRMSARVMKFRPFVDNETTVHDVHTYTDAVPDRVWPLFSLIHWRTLRVNGSRKLFTDNMTQRQKISPSRSNWKNYFILSRHGRMVWKVMQRNAWNETANRTTQQLYKVATSCVDVPSEKEEMGSVGEMSMVRSQKVFFFFACIWRALVDLISHGPWTELLVL